MIFPLEKQPFNPIRIHLRAHFKLANNAVDRNTDTCTRTRAIGYGAQFNVVLGKVHNIYSINILFKNDHGDGMYTYNPPKKQINTLCDRIAFLWLRFWTSDAIICPWYPNQDCSDISSAILYLSNVIEMVKKYRNNKLV